jgi:hypothetical protein
MRSRVRKRHEKGAKTDSSRSWRSTTATGRQAASGHIAFLGRGPLAKELIDALPRPWVPGRIGQNLLDVEAVIIGGASSALARAAYVKRIRKR